MGKALGVDNKWAYNAIKAVGNFGEMWDRSITVLGVPRGINAAVEQGRPAIRPADPLIPRGGWRRVFAPSPDATASSERRPGLWDGVSFGSQVALRRPAVAV